MSKPYSVMPAGQIRVWNNRAKDVADLLYGDNRFPYSWGQTGPLRFVDVYPNSIENRDYLCSLLDELL